MPIIRRRARRARARRRSRATIRRANARRKPSRFELEVMGALDSAGISYQSQFKVGRCHVDLAFPRDGSLPTLVELQGCFHHGCIRCYPETTRRHATARRKDARRLAFLRSGGFELLEVWLCDWKQHPKLELRRLINVARRGRTADGETGNT